MYKEIIVRGEEYDLHHHEDSEAEEILSLCDLPLDGHNSDQQEDHDLPTDQELFQFFNGFNTEKPCASSKDIIFCGKILQRNCPNATDDLPVFQSTPKARKLVNNEMSPKIARRASLCRKFPGDRKPASKWFKKCDTSAEGILASATPISKRPKWPLFILGFGKTPTVMELKDIRSRQSRLSPRSSPSPTFVEKGIIRTEGGKACWSLLHTLWCKRKMMNTSLGCISCV